MGPQGIGADLINRSTGSAFGLRLDRYLHDIRRVGYSLDREVGFLWRDKSSQLIGLSGDPLLKRDAQLYATALSRYDQRARFLNGSIDGFLTADRIQRAVGREGLDRIA